MRLLSIAYENFNLNGYSKTLRYASSETTVGTASQEVV